MAGSVVRQSQRVKVTPSVTKTASDPLFHAKKQAVILLDDLTAHQDDLQLHSISHGVVLLEHLAMDYRPERRRLRVVKMRGIEFRGGCHDFTIEKGSLAIYPRLIAAEHHESFAGEVNSSGKAKINKLLGGRA